MVKLSQTDYEKMVAHAESELPDEACGLIAGRIDGDDKIIEKVYLLTNIDHSNEHFSLDPKEQLAAVKDMRANGLKPLGNWHSHPESPSRPSEEDKRLAYDSSASYLILSLMDRENPVLNSFHIEGDVSEKEEFYVGLSDYRQRTGRTWRGNLRKARLSFGTGCRKRIHGNRSDCRKRSGRQLPRTGRQKRL